MMAEELADRSDCLINWIKVANDVIQNQYGNHRLVSLGL